MKKRKLRIRSSAERAWNPETVITKSSSGLAKCRGAGKGKVKYLRKCHVNLVMVGDRDAAKLGTRPGPHLQFCSGVGKAADALVPVNSPRQAAQLGRAYCECVKSGEDRASCAAQVRKSGLGGLRGRRRRKR